MPLWKFSPLHQARTAYHFTYFITYSSQYMDYIDNYKSSPQRFSRHAPC